MKINNGIFIAVLFAFIVFLSIAVWQRYLYSQSLTYIICGNNTITANSEGLTVGTLLKRCNISLETLDIVNPSLEAPAPRGGKVTVIRVKVRLEKNARTFPPKYGDKIKLAKNLRKTELQKAEQKTKQLMLKTTYYDGVKKFSETLKEYTIVKYFYCLNLLDSWGRVEKKYDLSKCKRIRMTATSYFPGDPLAWRDGTETLLGFKMQKGIVAVDPKVIPLRTRLFIPGYGYGYAGDTGSAIKGNKIDLGFDNGDQDRFWIHRPVTVYILEKSKKW